MKSITNFHPGIQFFVNPHIALSYRMHGFGSTIKKRGMKNLIAFVHQNYRYPWQIQPCTYNWGNLIRPKFQMISVFYAFVVVSIFYSYVLFMRMIANHHLVGRKRVLWRSTQSVREKNHESPPNPEAGFFLQGGSHRRIIIIAAHERKTKIEIKIHKFEMLFPKEKNENSFDNHPVHRCNYTDLRMQFRRDPDSSCSNQSCR